VKYWSGTKVILHCREAFWERDGISGGASFCGERIQQAYYLSVEGDPASGTALLASYTIGDDADVLGCMPIECWRSKRSKPSHGAGRPTPPARSGIRRSSSSWPMISVARRVAVNTRWGWFCSRKTYWLDSSIMKLAGPRRASIS